MLPVTHPKVLRSPNQIKNTLSAADQIGLCLHGSSLHGHAVAVTCSFISHQLWTKQKRQEIDFSFTPRICQSIHAGLHFALLYNYRHISLLAVTGRLLHWHLFVMFVIQEKSTKVHTVAKISDCEVLSTGWTKNWIWSIKPRHPKVSIIIHDNLIYRDP